LQHTLWRVKEYEEKKNKEQEKKANAKPSSLNR
jgi:hypothetical protein